MKLFVDDIRNAPDDSWHTVRTVTEAIRAIAKYYNEITEISLDHDISHAHYGDYPCKETFAAVAYFIGEKYIKMGKQPPKIVLHTANPTGAKNMEAILSDYGIPSTTEMKDFAHRQN